MNLNKMLGATVEFVRKIHTHTRTHNPSDEVNVEKRLTLVRAPRLFTGCSPKKNSYDLRLQKCLVRFHDRGEKKINKII